MTATVDFFSLLLKMQKRLLGFITWPSILTDYILDDSIVSYNNFLLIKLSQIINGTPFALQKKSDMQQKKKEMSLLPTLHL